MTIELKQIIFINEYPFLYGGTEHYVQQVALKFKELNFKTILFYHGGHHPDEKMQQAFDQLYPIVDIKKQLDEIPNSIVYLNNFRSPELIKELTTVKIPVFRFIHDHYLTCPRSSKTNPFTNDTCTKKVGLHCFTCPGVISRHEGKIVTRTPWATKKELLLHNNFKNIIVSSNYLLKEITRNGIWHKRVSINPIYQSEMNIRKDVKLKKNENQIIYIGSLIKGKGVDLIIKALKKCPYEFDLKIIGEGAWREKLEKLAQSTPMKSKVEFVGKVGQTELAKYYQQSKAVIVASTLPETFSKAGADALHFGTLPICSEVGGISSWLSEGKNGVFFKSGSASELTKALNNLFEKKYDHIIEKIGYIPSSLPNIDVHVSRLIEIFYRESDRKALPRKYSYAENKQFINIMDETCSKFKEIVLRHLGKEKVDSIILIGGYGRGEGGVIVKNNMILPHNNLDFQIILNTFKTSEAAKKRDAIIADVNKLISKEQMITLDFSFNTKFKIKFGVPQLVYYDMKFGHRLVYGDDNWLLNIQKYNSRNISLHDIRELLINRGTLLILNKKILTKNELSKNKKMKMIVIKHLIKAIIGYGDALLYLHGKYHWSYKRKGELMWTIAPEYPSFARMYIYAIHFRFNPNYENLLHRDLHKLQKYVTRSVEKIHLAFERQICQKKDFNWQTYFNLVTKNPLYSKKISIINIFKFIYENFINNKYKSCDDIIGIQKLHCQFVGSKGFLMAIFPYILYEIPLPKNISRHLDSPIDYYIKSWGQTNDENFEQSLPGQLIKPKDAA